MRKERGQTDTAERKGEMKGKMGRGRKKREGWERINSRYVDGGRKAEYSKQFLQSSIFKLSIW